MHEVTTPMFSIETVKQEFDKDLNFMYEANRFETFKTWLYSDDQKCNARKVSVRGILPKGQEIIIKVLIVSSLDVRSWIYIRRQQKRTRFSKMFFVREKFGWLGTGG